jgi:hypothetical protein
MNTRCPFTAICFDAECTILNIKELYGFHRESEKSHPPWASVYLNNVHEVLHQLEVNHG